MITEDYVSFGTAKLLKEKGFDVSTTNVYYDFLPSSLCFPNEKCRKGVLNLFYTDEVTEVNSSFRNTQPIPKYIAGGVYSAPTLQMTMKWLREVHNIDIDIDAHCGMLSIRCYVAYVSTYKPYELTDTDKEFGITEDEVKHRQVQFKRNTRTPLPHELIPAHEYFDTYEEACEAAIKYCLTNLI